MFNSVFPIYSIFVTVNSLHKIAIKRYKMTNSIWLNASPKFMLLSTKCSDIVFTFGFAINLTGFRSRSVVVVFSFFFFFFIFAKPTPAFFYMSYFYFIRCSWMFSERRKCLPLPIKQVNFATFQFNHFFFFFVFLLLLVFVMVFVILCSVFILNFITFVAPLRFNT